MERGWNSVVDLQAKLIRQLGLQHVGLVTQLWISQEGDTLILHGEVASEHCKGDAKRFLLSFDGVFKVRNELVVAGFLEAASSEVDDFLEWKGPRAGRDLSEWHARGEVEQPLQPGPNRRGTLVISEHNRRLTGADVEAPDVKPPHSAVEVVRYPEITATGTIAPRESVSIKIDLAVDSLRGLAPISLGNFSADWDSIEVRVQLFAPWAAEMTVEKANITLFADGTSEPAHFKLVVSDSYVKGTPAQLHSSFMHGTRVCGHLSQDLSDDEGAAAAKKEEMGVDNAMNTPSAVTIIPEAIGPTLSVRIACGASGTQIWMWAAHVPGGIEEGSEQITLGSGDQAFAESLLRACPDLGVAEFRRRMAGIGVQIWEAAPTRFRLAYAEWRAKIGPSFPIQFLSDDPHVPWEMMKPDFDGVDHLFLEHPVARWPLTRAARRRHTFPGGALLSFVPSYADGRALPSARAEAEWLRANLKAVAMPATSEAFLKVLDGEHPASVGILHFAGHGAIDTGLADGGIDMEDRMIGISEVNQSRVVLGVRNGTLVVLNACETAAGSKLLGMNIGWGNVIAVREFGGLVAPLWEVQDDVALAIVQTALPKLMDGSSSLGEAVRAARFASGNTSISAFAYVAHGDVMARFAKA
jgi:hypothetical protein